jgi:hypothetical protein
MNASADALRETKGKAMITWKSKWVALRTQTSVAAKAGDTGAAFQGAISVSPGVSVYQLTESGLALELTAKGTKYYKDDDLT